MQNVPVKLFQNKNINRHMNLHHPPHPSELSDIPIDEIPEPEIILLSSDSDTVSFLTDTTLGK